MLAVLILAAVQFTALSKSETIQTMYTKSYARASALVSLGETDLLG